MINGAQNLWNRAVPLTLADASPNTYPGYILTTTGTVTVTPMLDNGLPGADITFTAAPCGMIIPFPCLYVKSTGATATVAGLV